MQPSGIVIPLSFKWKKNDCCQQNLFIILKTFGTCETFVYEKAMHLTTDQCTFLVKWYFEENNANILSEEFHKKF